MQKKLGFGLIGTGAVSGFFAKGIRELADAELVAVCSSSPERQVMAEKRFQVPAYSAYHDLIARPDIDVVCILTESGNHLDPAILAAKSGKHVLCEKPLEINLERADRIIDACRKANVKLGCIFQNRFKPDYILLKESVEKGELGKLLFGNAYIKWFRDAQYYSKSRWRGTLAGDGGGALINQGIHTLDLLLDIMGEPSEVIAKTARLIHRIEGEDLALAIVQFKNGAFGTIEASTALYPGYPEKLEIYCEKGSVILEGGKIISWMDGSEHKEFYLQVGGTDTGSSDPMAIDYRWHKMQIEDMIQAVKEDREPAVNGEEGRKALALVRAVYESAQKGRPVWLG